MKKVAINPRKYYNTPSRNYVAGQSLVVEDSEAEAMKADGIANVIEDEVVAEVEQDQEVIQKEEIAE